ncbi:MAG: hypothetical protein ACHQHO_02335 [Solirubrobacterales bacterium]
MSYLAVVLLFPALLAVLSLGSGLLVGRLTGARLPALLLLPIGFATLVLVSQFTTRDSFTAPLTPWLLLALALLGLGLARGELVERWRLRGSGWSWLWCPLAAVAVYAIVSAPLIAAGRLTFPGYLLDTTGAVQLMGAEWLLHHGNDFSSVAGIPAYGTTLNAYFGNGYPSGAHTALASVGWLSGQDLLWLYSPFQAFDLAITALVLMFVAMRAGLGRFAAAVAGLVAAIPALVYSYALMGSIKELTALPMLVLMGALLTIARPLARSCGLRATLPFAVAAAGAIGAIGIAATPWIGLFGAAALLSAIPIATRRDALRFVLAGAVLVAVVALLALPTLLSLSKTLALAEGVSASNAQAVNDPGNLLRPLRFVQSLGVWLGETHRLDPRYLNQTYIGIGIVIVAIAAGLIWLLRRRAWAVLAFIAISFVARLVLVRHGTEWADAKLLVLLSPVLLLLAMIGAWSAIGSGGAGRLLLMAAVAAGVIASDALAYHGTNTAPTGRYSELRTIGVDYAREGPALTPDFDEYALYLLRDSRPTGPGFGYAGPFTFSRPQGASYGHSYDLDDIGAASVQRFPLIVMRRSPERSRPPSDYTLLRRGSFYEVWRRAGEQPELHVGLGNPVEYQAAAVPSCRELGELARRAERIGGRLAVAPRPLNVAASLTGAVHSPTIAEITDLEGRRELGFNGPGRIETGAQVRHAGVYELWLGGSIDSRGVRVLVDHRLVGEPSAQSGDDANVVAVARLSLSAGHHDIQLVRRGGGLQPGNNAGTVIDGIVFEPVAAELQQVQQLDPRAWRSLCGRPLDWVELLRRS